MNKKVRLSPLAKNDLLDILEYLVNKWRAKTANNFLNIFEEDLKRIAAQPKQFPHFRKDLNISKCVVTKHNTLYFRESIFQIEVVRIYDVRQHPNKLKFKL